MKFSIITPSFRQPEWLRLCVASVADQQGVQVEHLVQDAGTPGLQPADFFPARMEIKPDDGMYDAINHGLDRATGEICAHLNCDEQYLPEALQRVAQIFEAEPATDAVLAGTILTRDDGTPITCRRAILPRPTYAALVNSGVHSCSVFWRRRLSQEGLRFDPAWKLIGDAAFFLELMRRTSRIRVVDFSTSAFTFTGVNMGDDPRMVDEAIRRRTMPGSPPEWLRLPSVALHRVRRFLAGAQRPTTMDVALYTLAGPEKRTLFAQSTLSAHWPQTACRR